MRLPPMPMSIIDEIEASRPKQGDHIEFENEEYVIKAAGLKYLVCIPVSNPRIERWLRHQQVCRWVPPSPEEMEDHEMRTPLIKRQA